MVDSKIEKMKTSFHHNLYFPHMASNLYDIQKNAFYPSKFIHSLITKTSTKYVNPGWKQYAMLSHKGGIRYHSQPLVVIEKPLVLHQMTPRIGLPHWWQHLRYPQRSHTPLALDFWLHRVNTYWRCYHSHPCKAWKHSFMAGLVVWLKNLCALPHVSVALACVFSRIIWQSSLTSAEELCKYDLTVAIHRSG